MRFFNWAKIFEETPTCEDILKKVGKLEKQYWIWLAITVFIAVSGFNRIQHASNDNIKQIAIGVCLVIVGIVNVAVIKLWAHIKLTMYFIIWDRENRIKAEINKLEAQDL